MAAWETYFSFVEGEAFDIDGPSKYNGHGSVLEKTDTTLRLHIQMPRVAILDAINGELTIEVREDGGPGNGFWMCDLNSTPSPCWGDDDAKVRSNEQRRERTIESSYGVLELTKKNHDRTEAYISSHGLSGTFHLKRKEAEAFADLAKLVQLAQKAERPA